MTNKHLAVTKATSSIKHLTKWTCNG